MNTQTWIAISVFILVAIIKKRRNLSTDLNNISDFVPHSPRKNTIETATSKSRLQYWPPHGTDLLLETETILEYSLSQAKPLRILFKYLNYIGFQGLCLLIGEIFGLAF